MKKILITGANSYIGTSFENYIKENFPDAYAVDTVDMIDGTWREKDFSGYDSVFHVAGIAQRHTGPVNEQALGDCVRTILAEYGKGHVSSGEELLAYQERLRQRKGIKG